MFYSFQLEKCFIEKKILTVSINGTFNYINSSRKPKISITFDNNVKNRRLPLKIVSLYLDSNSNKCFIHAECDYELEYLFWGKENYDDISIRFSLIYGGDYIDNLKLDFKDDNLISDDIYYKINLENRKIAISPQKKLKEYYAFLNK